MNQDLLNMENIRDFVEKRKIGWTKHCLNRLNQRDISIEDAKHAIKNGEIVEYYYDDYPYQSCLIVGNDEQNEVLHVVCGINDEIVYMITAYHPDTDEWEEDMKTRRDK